MKLTESAAIKSKKPDRKNVNSTCGVISVAVSRLIWPESVLADENSPSGSNGALPESIRAMSVSPNALLKARSDPVKSHFLRAYNAMYKKLFSLFMPREAAVSMGFSGLLTNEGRAESAVSVIVGNISRQSTVDTANTLYPLPPPKYRMTGINTNIPQKA